MKSHCAGVTFHYPSLPTPPPPHKTGENRGVSHYRILPISRDIGWPVQQLDYFWYKSTYTDC